MLFKTNWKCKYIYISFDFHDDGNDARFCIRNINSVANLDGTTEALTVDNGNVSCTGNITISSAGYIYAGGLRLGGWDGNTLCNDIRVLGITTLNKIYGERKSYIDPWVYTSNRQP